MAGSYETGHVKRNSETGDVALRTIFPEDQGPQLANMAWLVATPNSGARHAGTPEIDSWTDLYTPTTAEEPTPPAEEPVPPPPVEP